MPPACPRIHSIGHDSRKCPWCLRQKERHKIAVAWACAGLMALVVLVSRALKALFGAGGQ